MTQFSAEVLVAGSAAVLTVLAGLFRSFIADRRDRRKYPVAGRYIMTYRAKSDAQIVTIKAPAVLHQRGREVSGEMIEFSERAWRLNGRIEEGFLTGVYHASDPTDDSKGTFFLKVDGAHRDMTGSWAGWENRELDAGDLTFRRRLDSTVRRAEANEIPGVRSLLGDALGDLYVDFDTFNDAASNTDRATCLVALGPQGGLMGASTFYLVSSESFGRFLPVGQESVGGDLRVFRFNENVGLLRAVAVREEYRGRGVATELLNAGIEWCKDNGATAMLTVAWAPRDNIARIARKPGEPALAGIMNAAAFQQVLSVPNYWTQDSEPKDYTCPVCGRRCGCGATFFTRSLEGGRPGGLTGDTHGSQQALELDR